MTERQKDAIGKDASSSDEENGILEDSDEIGQMHPVNRSFQAADLSVDGDNCDKMELNDEDDNDRVSLIDEDDVVDNRHLEVELSGSDDHESESGVDGLSGVSQSKADTASVLAGAERARSASDTVDDTVFEELLQNTEKLVSRCTSLANQNTFEICTKLDMNHPETLDALNALEELAITLEDLEIKYRCQKNCYPLLNDRHSFGIGHALNAVISDDESLGLYEWADILSALLSDESPVMRKNIRVKIIALRFLLSILDSNEYGFSTDYWSIMEGAIPSEVLLAYAYGNAFLSENNVDITASEKVDANVARQNADEDALAKQVKEWWKNSPDEARRLRDLATGSLFAYAFANKACADYMCEAHPEKGMNLAFPVVLLDRIRSELLPNYEKHLGIVADKQNASDKVSLSLSNKKRKPFRSNHELPFGMSPIFPFNITPSKSDGANASLSRQAQDDLFDSSESPLSDKNERAKKSLRHSVGVLYALADQTNRLVRYVLQEDGLNIIMRIFHLGDHDVKLVCDAAWLAAYLNNHPKFAHNFQSSGCLQLLFEITATSSLPPYAFYAFSFVLSSLTSSSISRLCRMPLYFVRQLNKFMVSMLSHEHDLTRSNALKYWVEALKFPLLLRMFDAMHGVRYLLDSLADPNCPKNSIQVENLVLSVTSVLVTYMRAQVAIAAHNVQSEAASLEPKGAGNSTRTNSQETIENAPGRTRSSSAFSYSSIGSKSSISRNKAFPDDQPMELDQAAHESSMSILQSNRALAMRILSNNRWKPVESILSYRCWFSREEETGYSRPSHQSGHERTPSHGTPGPQFGATATTPAKSISGAHAEGNGATNDLDSPPAIAMLLQIVNFANSVEAWRQCTETCANALHVLLIVTLLPHTYKIVCECNVPIKYCSLAGDSADTWIHGLPSDENETIQGITVLLEAASLSSLEYFDPMNKISVLRILCNCCSPSMGDDRYQRPVRRLARYSNALMTLLSLLRYKERFYYADMFRYLACLALNGLANDHHVTQVLETLNVTQLLTQIIRSEPAMVENKRIHRRLKREALKLIERVSDICEASDKNLTIGDVADATNKRLLRSSIVERTQISFDLRELIGLVKDHLGKHGFDKTVASLEEEISTLYSDNKSSRMKEKRTMDWPQTYLFQSNSSKRRFRFASQQPDSTNALNSNGDGRSQDKFVLMSGPFPSQDLQSNVKRRRLVSSLEESGDNLPPNAKAMTKKYQGRILHSSTDACTKLEKIVVDYLREQHRRCPDPVSIVPPFSLRGERHECVSNADVNRYGYTGEISGNVFKRLHIRELASSGVQQPGFPASWIAQDVKYIHGRHKLACTMKNITRNDDELANASDGTGLREGIAENESFHSVTAVSFLHHTSDYEDLLLGTSNGDLVLRNTETCHAFSKWNIHRKAIESVAVTPCGTRVLTCSPESGNAMLNRLPESVVQTYEGPSGSERSYMYSSLERNRQEDELTELWQEDNIGDIELDRYGHRVVATLLKPDGDGHEHAAVVYDLQEGKEIVKLLDNKLSIRYWWHRACFSPDGNNTVLHDGLLWDVRAPKVVHKFDKLSELGHCTFKPDGSQVVIDGSVWDMRTFKLFVMCPLFEASEVIFDAESKVAYSYRPDLRKYDDQNNHGVSEKWYSAFSVTDVSDYSTITTLDIAPLTVQGLALDPFGQRLAVVTQRFVDEVAGEQRNVRVYDIGHHRTVDDTDMDSEDSEDGDGSSEEDDEGEGSFDDSGSENDDFDVSVTDDEESNQLATIIGELSADIGDHRSFGF